MLCGGSNDILARLSLVCYQCRGVCTAVAPALVLLGAASHDALVLGHLGIGSLKCPWASVCPEEHISSFSVVLMSLKTQHSRRQKGCSANSLIFRKSVEVTRTLKLH